jgi:hypothetical protein
MFLFLLSYTTFLSLFRGWGRNPSKYFNVSGGDLKTPKGHDEIN